MNGNTENSGTVTANCQTPTTPSAPDVYARIAAVSGDLARIGIGKDSTNVSQGYRFRGIDAFYNALAPLLAKHGLVILPRIIERTITERTTPKGTVLFSVVVAAEFTFASASDGSTHVVRTYGEAMDSGDKATNKAMSAAYKYAAMQTFCIPTEGDNDADATTHAEIVAAPTVPDGFDDWWAELQAAAGDGLAVLKAAWDQSDAGYRKYLTTTHAAEWNALKKAAAKTKAVSDV